MSDLVVAAAKARPTLTLRVIDAKVVQMKRKKGEKASPGTEIAAKYRARCNELSEAEREKLGAEFLKLYYAGTAKPARRR